MGDAHGSHTPTPQDTFSGAVRDKAERKIQAQRDSAKGVWFGLGMMGLIGWSVVVPTLIGAAVGHWLDDKFPGHYTWTLSLLVAGLVIGCWNAWIWVAKEDRAMHDHSGGDDE